MVRGGSVHDEDHNQVGLRRYRTAAKKHGRGAILEFVRTPLTKLARPLKTARLGGVTAVEIVEEVTCIANVDE